MKKGRKGRKFNREKDIRAAFVKGLAASLFLYGKIKTTEARAKTISSFAEKQITKARTGSLQAVRVFSGMFTKEIATKLVKEIAPKYKDRKGGYTRIIKLNPRKSDGARMAIIELV